MEKRRGGKVIPVEMDANFFYERALHYLDRNNYNKALKYFQRAVDQEPDNPVNHCNLAGVLAEMGLFEDSNHILQHVLEKVDPDFAEGYFYMANNWAYLEEYELAEECVLRYLEADENGEYRQEAEEMLQMLSEFLGRPPRAVRPRKETMLHNVHDKARRLLEEGRFAEATQLLERIVAEEPKFTAARNNLTLAYFYQGNLPEAFRLVRGVLDEDPGNVHALCNLAVLYGHLGERDGLQQVLTRLKKIVPLQVEQMFKQATTLGILGEHEEAYVRFRKLISLNALDDVVLYHYTAVAAVNTGRYEEAIRWWNRVVEKDPASPIPRFYLRVLEEMGAGELPPFPYQYHLPLEQMRQLPFVLDPQDDHYRWLRVMLHWGLRFGHAEMKLQVLQVLGAIGDHESILTLRQFVKTESDEKLKGRAAFLLAFLGDAHDAEDVAPYQAVLARVQQRFSLYAPQYAQEARHIWTGFLLHAYPHLPKIQKTAGWAAALEYLTLKSVAEPVTQRQIADVYAVSVSTLSKYVQTIRLHFRQSE